VAPSVNIWKLDTNDDLATTPLPFNIQSPLCAVIRDHIFALSSGWLDDSIKHVTLRLYLMKSPV
jgi:hypothetical protein